MTEKKIETVNTALTIPQEQENVALIEQAERGKLDLFFGGEMQAVWTSIPADGSRESQVKMYNAFDAEGGKLRDIQGQVLEVQHILVHKVEIMDMPKPGEAEKPPVLATRVVLIDKDGQAYSSVATGVVSSLQKMFAVFGPPPWENPIRMTAKEVGTRRGFRTLQLKTLV